jgi:aspartate carbamoyltransferase catalytic subunit
LRFRRTVHSLVILLAMFENIKLQYVAPPGLELPENISEELVQKGTVVQVAGLSLDEAILNTDVLYVTRIQKERFESEEEYEKLLGSYCINAAVMSKAKEFMSVLHPLPR